MNKSLAMFADPSKWDIRYGIPLFPAHEEVQTDEDGNEFTVKFDAKKLAEMARDANRREIETQSAAPLVVGHMPRDPNAYTSEIELGPLVGYNRNFRVGLFEGTPTILADWWSYKDRRHYFREFPRRSIEVWNNSLIDPVCLVKRTPQFDLGQVTDEHQPKTQELPRRFGSGALRCLTYSRGANRRIYQMEGGNVDDSIKGKLAEILQQALTLLQGGGAEGNPAPDDMGGAGAGAGAGPTADDMGGGAGGMPAQYAKQLALINHRVTRVEKQGKVAEQRAEQNRKLYEKEKKRSRLLTAKYEGELPNLEVEEELEYVKDLDELQFEKHMDRVTSGHYSRGETFQREDESGRGNKTFGASQRQAQERSKAAVAAVLAARQRGEKTTFEAELAKQN